MSKIVQGITVRDHYPDYPQDLKDWELWQIKEAHEIGIRTALTSCGCMDSKFHIRSWKGKTSTDAMEKHGHSHLGLLKCSCFINWSKVVSKKLLPYVFNGQLYTR